MGEFDLIARYFTHRARHALLGVGDDAALIAPRRGQVLAVSTDMLVEGRHFFRGADPEKLGHKALAVNLSDMAAMGAVPRWATLALALPRIDEKWLAAFSRGFMRLARAHDVDLIGGDTTRGPLNLSVTIFGEVPARQAMRRDGARAGDDIWVSGKLGDAALAVAATRSKALKKVVKKQIFTRIQRRLDMPTPRVALGVALRGIARSAIDISDGLIADLGHICERSQVSASIDFDKLPASNVLRPLRGSVAGQRALLAGGDDYELCFTAPRTKHAQVMRVAKRANVSVTRIGSMTAGRGARVIVLDGEGKPMLLAIRGYDHFG